MSGLPRRMGEKTSPIRNAIIGLAEKELIPLLNESENIEAGTICWPIPANSPCAT